MIEWNEKGNKIKQTNNLHGDWIINIKTINNQIITNSRDGSVKVRQQ